MKKLKTQKKISKTAASIKAVVFDYGGVIIKDNQLALEAKYKFRKKSKAVQKRFDEANHRTELGQIPFTQAAKEMATALGYKGTPKELMDYIIKADLIKPTWKIVQALKKDYIVGILSNNKKQLPQKSAKHNRISLKGIHIFNSSDIGYRKPGPEIYKYAIRKLKFKPSEIVFIDDRSKNVNGALKAGMKGIVFKNSTTLIKALKKIGVEVRM